MTGKRLIKVCLDFSTSTEMDDYDLSDPEVAEEFDEFLTELREHGVTVDVEYGEMP